MKILVVTPELAGLAPVGGLAEFVLGLGTALLRRGHEVRVAIPSYGYLRSRSDLQRVNNRLVVQLGVGASEVSTVDETRLDCPGDDGLKLPVVLVGEHKHFRSVRSPEEVYRWPNHEPWIAFSRSVIDLLDSWSWRPDVIHCQDPHTALVPVYIKQLRKQDASRSICSARTVLTVHRLHIQGIGGPTLVHYAGLRADWFQIEGFEYHGSANCFKAGLLSADRVSTVSPTYANEMCESSDFGFGLEGVMRRLKEEGRLWAILNGIDLDRWKMAGVNYDGSDSIDAVLRAKENLRRQLYRAWRWNAGPEPVVAVRSRWDEEKGVGFVGGCIEQILAKARVIMRMWGTPGASVGLRDLWARFCALAEQRPDRFLIDPPDGGSVVDAAAHYTIADFFLMPSRCEPCGLAQMECQRYGTIPIVRQTGGLAATVSENRTHGFPSPNGFLFREATSESLVHAVERAAEAFYDAQRKQELIRNALLQQNGWASRAAEYEALLGG